MCAHCGTDCQKLSVFASSLLSSVPRKKKGSPRKILYNPSKRSRNHANDKIIELDKAINNLKFDAIEKAMIAGMQEATFRIAPLAWFRIFFELFNCFSQIR